MGAQEALRGIGGGSTTSTNTPAGSATRLPKKGSFLMSLTRRAILLLLPLLFAALPAIFATPAAAQQTANVAVGDIWFCDSSFSNGICNTQITAGDTVVWDFGSGNLPHTATECGASCDTPTGTPLWDSGVLQGSGTFSHTFNTPGTFLYVCQVHPFQMRGEIVVQAAQQPTSTPDAAQPTDDGIDSPATTDSEAEAVANSETADLPIAGLTQEQGAAQDQWLGPILVAISAVAIGAAWYTRKRWQEER